MYQVLSSTPYTLYLLSRSTFYSTYWCFDTIFVDKTICYKLVSSGGWRISQQSSIGRAIVEGWKNNYLSVFPDIADFGDFGKGGEDHWLLFQLDLCIHVGYWLSSSFCRVVNSCLHREVCPVGLCISMLNASLLLGSVLIPRLLLSSLRHSQFVALDS